MKATGYRIRGFTLVEIMIVVSIVGILAMIAIPGFKRAIWNSANARYANDVRVAADAFCMYAMENGGYPPDRNPAAIPVGMAPYLEKVKWTEETALGGRWDWDYEVFGIVAGVSVYRPKAGVDQLRALDKTIDDGNLGSGVFRARSDGYIYIIEF